MRRFVAWFLWSALFGLLPYAIASLMYWLNSAALPSWAQLMGAGQIFLTSAALLGSGLKELSQAQGNSWQLTRVVLTWSAAVFLVLVGVAYGMVAASAAGGGGPISVDRVVQVSMIAYPVSLLAAAAAIVATQTPRAVASGVNDFQRVGDA